MKLGASTKSFGGMALVDTAALFSNSGLCCAELCFCQTELGGWKYNLSGYEPLPKLSDAENAKRIFADFGIVISSVGIYNCLWQGDSEAVADSLKYFCEYCDLACDMGVKLITTHSGTPGFRSDTNKTDRFYGKVFECFVNALVEAEKRGLYVAVECSDNDALSDYGDFLRLKEYTEYILGRSNMLKYIGVPVCDGICADNEDSALFHIKDRKRDGRFFERFGDGDGDFKAFFKSCTPYTDKPVILEYVNSANLLDTVGRVKNAATLI